MPLVSQTIEGVSGIPRQYRWTKKPAPTEISSYVTETSTAFNLFKVLESVEQTGTSLQRFKRKATAVAENNSDSDENKIRRQLLLDAEHFKSWALSCDIEVSQIEALISRINGSAEPGKICGPIHSVPDMTDDATTANT
ncbi:unnamed protein product [Gongylonema pulchrum]|uniref:DUF3510 domain-containing protein n=1 Tax=Gongylonema pulchrum TaxID=637853 RepID=A0A183E7E6_9BILA|nr:unnamed protein product [Gongylonema pulchrum]